MCRRPQRPEIPCQEQQWELQACCGVFRLLPPHQGTWNPPDTESLQGPHCGNEPGSLGNKIEPRSGAPSVLTAVCSASNQGGDFSFQTILLQVELHNKLLLLLTKTHERRIRLLISREPMASNLVFWIILSQTSWVASLSPLKWSVECFSVKLIWQLKFHRWFSNLSTAAEKIALSGVLCLNCEGAAGAFEMLGCSGDGGVGAWPAVAYQPLGAANFSFTAHYAGKAEEIENFSPLLDNSRTQVILPTRLYLLGLQLFCFKLHFSGKVILAYVESGGAWEVFGSHLVGMKLSMDSWKHMVSILIADDFW